MNLTFDVRDGILKHMFTRAADPKRPLSTIAQATAIPEYAIYRKNNGSLEAQCVYFADKLAYLFGDIEDGVRSNILRYGEIQEDDFFVRLREKYEAWRPNRGLPELVGIGDFPSFRSSALTVLILDCIEAATDRIEDNDFAGVEDVLSCSDRIVQVNPEIERSVGSFYEKWMRHHLFRDKDVVTCEFKARRIVRDLFEAYLGEQDLTNQLCRKQCERGYSDICDSHDPLFELIPVRNYIAGMTDFFATQQHARLYRSSERATL